MSVKKYHVKKGDAVKVISGVWKGCDAKILAVIKKTDRVVLEMSNLPKEKQRRIGKRTVKQTRENPHGGLVERSVSVHVSNVEKQKTEN